MYEAKYLKYFSPLNLYTGTYTKYLQMRWILVIEPTAFTDSDW